MVWVPDHIWYAQKQGKGTGKGWGQDMVIMNFLKGWGGDSGWGGKGWGRSKGGTQQAELISKIKDFQRSGEEQKQAWWTFCDSQGGGNRDPARHEAHVLQNFLAQHGIQVDTGNSFLKGELILKIKDFQRSGEEQKQAWWAFCDSQGGKRDPALHTVDVLQSFLAQHGIQVAQGTQEQKSKLVAKIKSYQTSGEAQKQQWWAFCDAQIGKKRDPALHSVATLEAFIASNGL
eukprot:TRINITY_DN1698_c0_g1_i3.p1 TRINITY_DN1698_c0_g1~~TRINITY_DN1698_c0_g1_i3.p1  ORF type:complete len:231 (+),score=50.53 TRINITY_DN1698_c0_g1_i3:114-806(+)